MTIETIFAFASLLGGLITVYVNLRISAATERVRREELERRLDRYDLEIKQRLDELSARHNRMETKLDQILERGFAV